MQITKEELVKAINAVAATHEGKLVFASLMYDCHWETTYLASDDPQTTHFHAVKRGVYGALRSNIRDEYLKEIEFNYKMQVKDGRDDKPDDRVKRSDRKPRK